LFGGGGEQNSTNTGGGNSGGSNGLGLGLLSPGGSLRPPTAGFSPLRTGASRNSNDLKVNTATGPSAGTAPSSSSGNSVEQYSGCSLPVAEGRRLLRRSLSIRGVVAPSSLPSHPRYTDMRLDVMCSPLAIELAQEV
jgi:hypothetical protein